MRNGALVVFVKTPEVSAVKTRLAATIGQDLAILFYKLSLLATRALLSQLKFRLPNLEIYWAVAEESAIDNEMWKSFKVIYQGEGGLGDRLDRVYRKLLEQHRFVCFMGADSPHILTDTIEKGIRILEHSAKDRFVVGETIDGGFYFFGGGIELPSHVWLSVDYSTDKTAQQLEFGLRKLAGIELIEKQFDIDTFDDLMRLTTHSKDHLPEQTDLIYWARSFK